MASGELLASSKFYVQFDGLDDLTVKKVSGIQITLETAGDKKPMGVSKGGKSQMQATVTGVSNGKITVEFVSSVEDDRLMKSPILNQLKAEEHRVKAYGKLALLSFIIKVVMKQLDGI
jgi:hypothetical protein